MDTDYSMPCPLCGVADGLNVFTVEMHGQGKAYGMTASGEDEGQEIIFDTLVSEDIGRRHTAAFWFVCEMCDRVGKQWMQQHKGSTYVGTEDMGPREIFERWSFGVRPHAD